MHVVREAIKTGWQSGSVAAKGAATGDILPLIQRTKHAGNGSFTYTQGPRCAPSCVVAGQLSESLLLATCICQENVQFA